MCRGTFALTISILLLGSSFSFAAESWEEARLKGFAEHQKEGKQFDKTREAGEISWLEEQEQWDEARRKEGDAYKRNRKAVTMEDDGPDAKADQKEKAAYKKVQEIEREKFVIQKTNDQKVIEAADKLGVAMVFTGVRHFRH